MRVLLVNDDGYFAAGIRTLARILQSKGHTVTVCAPDRERSAASHSLTVYGMLRTRPFEEDGIYGYAVDGTPVDCANLGCYLLKDEIDMVISGINHGPNMGGACVYSGTVGAAMEAAMSGCPAMAVSVDAYGDYRFEDAAILAEKVMLWAAEHPLPRGVLYNLNIPNLPYDQIRGVREATLSTWMVQDACYEKRVAPQNYEYFLMNGSRDVPEDDPNCDSVLCRQGWAVLTPLTWNFVHPGGMDQPEIRL